ncbi:MAG: hypothetical protein JEY79_09720 [Pseudodesulfovibrio sp.]|nr:hypothetical protein [Pseudodesulfovibrio sp.]
MKKIKIAQFLGATIQTMFWTGLYLGLFAYLMSQTASVNMFRYATF